MNLLMISSTADALFKGALMVLIGSAVVLLFLAVMGFPLMRAAKRIWFFVVPFELLAAVAFMLGNSPIKTAVGIVTWHAVRVIITAFMVGFNNKLLRMFQRKTVYSVLYTFGANLLAQIVLYYTCVIWF